MASIEAIKKEHDEILKELGNPELISNWDKFQELSKKKKELEKILDLNKEIEEIKQEIESNKEILVANEDPELSSLAQEELASLLEKQKKIESAIATLGQKDDQSKPQAIIVEIRAGTGGEEAALFAADLYKMYSKLALNQDWTLKNLDSNTTGIGGFKEVIFEIKGNNVWSNMEHEAGVHRVQRIPATEKNGRVHTSTATVAILQKPKKSDINIKPSDLKIDVYKSSGPGGQYVNKRETAVRITHLPTGLVVTSQNERNLLQNKENALAILEARLLEMEEREESQKLGEKRKAQIGKAQRVEKIRTYNFPQDRVTDHRIKKSWHNIEKIMAGGLKDIIDFLNSPNL